MFSSLYHAHHQRNLEDIPFWLWLAKASPGPVIELGCGTGRVLIPLAQAGYYTIGVDKDISMLRYLHTNVDKHLQPRPQIVVADLTRFHFATRVPLVILPCNTYSTLNDPQRSACLACVSRHLAPSGVFAVSLPNPQLLLNLPTRSEPVIEDEFIHPQTGNPMQVSSAWRRSKSKFTVTWIYDHMFPDGTVEHLVAETTHHILPVQAYLSEVERAGLQVGEIYGDYDRSKYEEDAPQLIIVASRPTD